VAEGLVKRSQAGGAPAIAVTLDVRTLAKRETFAGLRRTDTRECGSCASMTICRASRILAGSISAASAARSSPNLNWDLIKRLRDLVKVKLVLKGIRLRARQTRRR
jgi:4-hydroxymandelate oxidase